MAQWSPLLATVVLIVAGSYYTGPSMNPAVAASWHFHYVIGRRDLTEVVLVFWVAPFVGALVAGLLFRLLGGSGAPPRNLPAALKAKAA